MRPYTCTRASLCHNVASRPNIAILLFFLLLFTIVHGIYRVVRGKEIAVDFLHKIAESGGLSTTVFPFLFLSFPFHIDRWKEKPKKKIKKKQKRNDVRVTKHIALNHLNQMLNYLENMRKATRTIHDWLMLKSSSTTHLLIRYNKVHILYVVISLSIGRKEESWERISECAMIIATRSSLINGIGFLDTLFTLYNICIIARRRRAFRYPCASRRFAKALKKRRGHMFAVHEEPKRKELRPWGITVLCVRERDIITLYKRWRWVLFRGQ